MHPFDFKSALLAKHAQHVVLIHFPIALFIVSVAFDFLAVWRQSRALATAAYFNLTAAAVSALPTAATGVLAWQWQLEGQPLKGILRLHMMLGLLSTAFIWLVWCLHFRVRRKPGRSLPAYRLPIEFATAALVALTGHIGGFLSGINGPG